MTQKAEKKLLIGKKDIMECYQLSDYRFGIFLQLGMPVKEINGSLYAYVENLDIFFKNLLRDRRPLHVEEPAISTPN